MTREAFLEHWLGVHAPMWPTIPGLRGYIVNTIAQDHSRGDVAGLGMAPFDGVAQLWYDDLEARAHAGASAEGRAWHADGGTIIGGIRTFVTEEQHVLPLSGPRPPVKALSIIQRRPDHSSEQFQRYWRDVHGPMAKDVPEVRGFTLSGIVEEQFRHDIEPLPMDGPIDGFAESWVDSLDARARMVTSPEARTWFADGASFLGKVKTVVLAEQVLLPPPQ